MELNDFMSKFSVYGEQWEDYLDLIDFPLHVEEELNYARKTYLQRLELCFPEALERFVQRLKEGNEAVDEKKEKGGVENGQ